MRMPRTAESMPRRRALFFQQHGFCVVVRIEMHWLLVDAPWRTADRKACQRQRVHGVVVIEEDGCLERQDRRRHAPSYRSAPWRICDSVSAMPERIPLGASVERTEPSFPSLPCTQAAVLLRLPGAATALRFTES